MGNIELRRRLFCTEKPLYKLPVITNKPVTASGKTVYISVDASGLITMNGNADFVARIRPNGTVYTGTSSITEWFTIPDGASVYHEVYDLSYTNNGSLSKTISCKLGRSDNGGTYGTISTAMNAASGSDISFNATVTPNGAKPIGAYALQITSNDNAGAEVSFRVKLYVNGVRYL